jgi:hypothetical protein
MKKVLLTTTALVMTAGVASAEITFSGKGEAGVYRTAPTAAVAASAPTTGTGWAYDGTTDVLTLTETGTLVSVATTAAVDAELTAAARTAYLVALAADTDSSETATKDAHDTWIAAQATEAKNAANRAYILGTEAVAKGATPKLKAYSGYDFNVAASGASDNGMTFSMGFDMGAGLIADQDDDRAMDAQAGTVDTSAMTIGYAGYTVAIGDEKVDDLYDADGWNADVSISGSLGDLTVTIATDMDDDVKAVAATTAKHVTDGDNGADTFTAATAGTAAVYNPTSYAIAYSMGNVAFSMAGTEHDARGDSAAKMSLTYTVSDALSATYSVDNVGTYKDIAKLSATYTLSDAISITASAKDDKNHALNTNNSKKQSTDVSIAYSAGAMTSTLATDESSNWWVNAQYDLGGGAQAFTTFDHTEFLVAGVNFAF